MYYNGFKASLLKAWRWHQPGDGISATKALTNTSDLSIVGWLKYSVFNLPVQKKLLEHWKSPLGHFLHLSLPTNQKNKKINNPKHTLKLANQC